MDLFSIANIAFSVPSLGAGGAPYNISWVELVSTILGVMFVYGFIREKLYAYPLGILNSIGFIAIFYQVQLYSDLLLNIYFIIISITGWIAWKRTRENGDPVLEARWLSTFDFVVVLFAIAALTLLLGTYIDPIFGALAGGVAWILGADYTHVPAAMPFADAFTTVTSVFAMYLLVRKYINSWILWIAVDVIAIGIYLERGIMMMAIEYAVFLCMATTGLIVWMHTRHKLDVRDRVRSRSMPDPLPTVEIELYDNDWRSEQEGIRPHSLHVPSTEHLTAPQRRRAKASRSTIAQRVRDIEPIRSPRPVRPADNVHWDDCNIVSQIGSGTEWSGGGGGSSTVHTSSDVGSSSSSSSSTSFD